MAKEMSSHGRLLWLRFAEDQCAQVRVRHLRPSVLTVTLQQAAVCNKPRAANGTRLSPGVYRTSMPNGQTEHFGETEKAASEC